MLSNNTTQNFTTNILRTQFRPIQHLKGTLHHLITTMKCFFIDTCRTNKLFEFFDLSRALFKLKDAKKLWPDTHKMYVFV